MAIIAKQKYTQEKADKLLDYLKLYHEKGMPIDYEILVDGFKAVRRTNDPEMFTMFESFVTPDSKAVEILFYTGTSNNNDKHIFTFQDEPKEQGLSGIEIDNRIQEGIDREKRNWEFENLRRENKELKEEIEELEEEIEKLEKEKEELNSNQSPIKGVLGEIGSSFVEGFIRRNPKIIAKLPGGETLAGLIEEDNKEKGLEEGTTEETKVSFKPKSEASTTNSSEEDRNAISFVNQLKSTFTKDEFDQVLQILQHLSDHKDAIEKALNDLNHTYNG
jgi:FtsZ-binding cell division protein ZapB